MSGGGRGNVNAWAEHQNERWALASVLHGQELGACSTRRSAGPLCWLPSGFSSLSHLLPNLSCPCLKTSWLIWKFWNLMICFYLHPPLFTSLCTLRSLNCPCLWLWNFRQRRLSLQNTIFTHKTLLYSRKLMYWRDGKCQDWKERTGLQTVYFYEISERKKKKSLKTHILNRNEVTDGQGSVQ